MFDIFHKKNVNPKMQILQKPTKIEVVTGWEKDDDTYFAPGALVAVKNGKGILREVMLEPAPQSMMSLMLGDKPLFQLLGLLNSGYYTVWDTSLYPTDGNGHLFWKVPNEMVPLPGTCEYYYGDCEYADPHPYFMVGTQPRENYNAERVAYYRGHPGARAIAYFMEGYMTALLDGHHKAFAAALEHEKVNALVITPEYATRFRGDDGQSRGDYG